MQMRRLLYIPFLWLLITASAKRSSADYYPGFVPVKESKAYKLFLEQPDTDRNRLVYLIQRLMLTDIVIVYDSFQVPARLAAILAKAFLEKHYKDETPLKWINKWCSRSVITGEATKAAFPGGFTMKGREMLLLELRLLDEALADEPPRIISL